MSLTEARREKAMNRYPRSGGRARRRRRARGRGGGQADTANLGLPNRLLEQSLGTPPAVSAAVRRFAFDPASQASTMILDERRTTSTTTRSYGRAST